MKKQNKFLLGILLIGLMFPFTTQAQTVQDALNLMYGEQYKEAKQAIQTIITAKPDDDQNYYYAGFIYTYLKNADSAQLYFDQGLKINDKSALNFVGKGMLALQKGDSVQAQTQFDQAMKYSRSRNRTRVYNGIAEALLISNPNKADKAIALLKQAKEEAYNDKNEKIVTANTEVLMGDAYLAKHQAGQAIGQYKDAQLLNPDLSARIYLKIGDIYLAARNSKAALAQFQKAKEVDSTYAPAYASLGDIYFHYKRNGTQEAIKMYNKYLKLTEAKSGIKEKYVKVLYVGKNYEKAIEQIHEVLNNHPNDIVMNRLLGYSLYKTGKYSEANASFKKYFSIVTKKNMLVADYINYANSLIKQGNDSLGIKEAFKAIQLDSTSAIEGIQEMASEQLDQQKYEVAAQLYDKVLSVKKNLGSQDYYASGRAFLKSKEYTKADSSFTHLIKLNPKNYIGYYMMAFSKYFQDPDGKKGYLAKPYYDSVVKLTESKPDKYKDILINAYQYLAQYYSNNKNIDKAYSIWKKIDTLDPGNENAKQYFDYYKKVQEYKAKKRAADKKAAEANQ